MCAPNEVYYLLWEEGGAMRADHLNKTSKVTYLPGTQRSQVSGKNKLGRVLILLLVLYFTLLFATQYWRLVQFRGTLESIEQEIRAVHIQNEELRRDIERLHTPAYLEEMAREELGMVRSGELLFLFREADNP
jgi:cell division protein FtsL